MHESEFIGQDPSIGAYATILEGLASTWAAAPFDRLRVAVAYAKIGGLTSLEKRFSSAPTRWKTAAKFWMVSIDFGHTDPQALTRMLSMPNSQVRVPNGSEVLARKLRPRRCIHPKTYIFDQVSKADKPPFGLFVGSANLTVSALHVGTEHAINAHWIAPLSNAEPKLLASAQRSVAWWEPAWAMAEPINAKFILDYAKARVVPTDTEDTGPLVQDITTPAAQVIVQRSIATWASARYFWTETNELPKNLGAGAAGNQLDCRAGVRVFFGFTPNSVAKNTVFGEVGMRVTGGVREMKSVRYGNNGMDKVNLPIPGGTNPLSYDNTHLRFERIKPGEFEVTMATGGAAGQWRSASLAQGLRYTLSGGREFGFYS